MSCWQCLYEQHSCATSFVSELCQTLLGETVTVILTEQIHGMLHSMQTKRHSCKPERQPTCAVHWFMPRITHATKFYVTCTWSLYNLPMDHAKLLNWSWYFTHQAVWFTLCDVADDGLWNTTLKQALKLCYVIKQHSPYIQQKVSLGAVRFCPMASMFIHRVQEQVKTWCQQAFQQVQLYATVIYAARRTVTSKYQPCMQV